MEYILFSFILAGLPTLCTGYCNKMRDLIRLIFYHNIYCNILY